MPPDGSNGGDTNDPAWVYNLRKNKNIQLRDKENVLSLRVREIIERQERDVLWHLSVDAFPPYADYKKKTSREIPIFLAELGD